MIVLLAWAFFVGAILNAVVTPFTEVAKYHGRDGETWKIGISILSEYMFSAGKIAIFGRVLGWW